MTTEKKTAPYFLITSRPDPRIEAGFGPMSEIRLRLEEEESNTTRDVRLMIGARVEKLITGCNDYRVDDREFLIKKIMDRSGQSFLWVDLVFYGLENAIRVNKDKMDEIIRTVPEDLDKIYEDELGRSKDPEDTRTVLELIIASRTPLSLEDLNIALSINSKAQKEKDITLERNMERVVKMLCGFTVRISGGHVYLYHETTREFLLKSEYTDQISKAWKHSIDQSVANRVLATSCARCLLLQDWREPIKVPTSWLQGYNATDPRHLDSMTESVEIEWYYILPLMLHIPGFAIHFFRYALETFNVLAHGKRPWKLDPPDPTDIEVWLDSVGESSTTSNSGSRLNARRTLNPDRKFGLFENERVLERSLEIYKRPRSDFWFTFPAMGVGFVPNAEGRQSIRGAIMLAMLQERINFVMSHSDSQFDRDLKLNPHLSAACSRALGLVNRGPFGGFLKGKNTDLQVWLSGERELSRSVMERIQSFTRLLRKTIYTPLFTSLVNGNDAMVRNLLDDPCLQTELELLDDIATALTWGSKEHDLILLHTVLHLRRKFWPEALEINLLQEAVKWERFCLLPAYTAHEGPKDHSSDKVIIQALDKGHAEMEEELTMQTHNLGLKFTALALYRNTALHLCLRRRPTDSTTKAIGLLLERGADPNSKDPLGMSPLDIITVLPPTKESAETVRLLVQHGANVNEKGPNGRIPLQNTIAYSASADVVETAAHLLSNDADARAIDLAYLPFNDDLISLEKLIEILIDKSATAKRGPPGRLTLLHKLAASPDSQELPRIIDSLILKGKMDPNVLDGNGQTPLKYGLKCRHISDEDVFNGSASWSKGLSILMEARSGMTTDEQEMPWVGPIRLS